MIAGNQRGIVLGSNSTTTGGECNAQPFGLYSGCQWHLLKMSSF
jgi:hypothetical protein